MTGRSPKANDTTQPSSPSPEVDAMFYSPCSATAPFTRPNTLWRLDKDIGAPLSLLENRSGSLLHSLAQVEA